MSDNRKAAAKINAILDIAENLFIEKGYEQTTINDILAASGFAKGSLYYYFKSKQDVLDGIIRRRGDVYLEKVSAIAAADQPSARERLLLAILSMNPQDEREQALLEHLEKVSNGQMFIKSLTDIVQRIAPVIQTIIEQGITEGVFDTPFPLESAEILLASAHALFDNDDFTWTTAEAESRLFAFILAMERVLGAEAGSLAYLAHSLMG